MELIEPEGAVVKRDELGDGHDKPDVQMKDVMVGPVGVAVLVAVHAAKDVAEVVLVE